MDTPDNCMVCLYEFGGEDDPAADELPAHIPPELPGPLDGPRSEDVSAVPHAVYPRGNAGGLQ
ncbi:E3 ubiquitin-protein ligase rha1b [Phtheirospermum japonicum]|uniref:E3 ubiquitin-protein ligase rha1b n=1 Tax=Phtheirospermum japonicum TaxID=374723 RepID=A0A830BX35_9LAMI|nr:E3 ubiquitin-protein ligase rha1b [Phtheirospermum japonicum]